MEVAYFKRHQKDDIFHYYQVYGGPGKTEKGYQVVVNFLNDFPIIFTEHNSLDRPTGTWCQYEVGIPITEGEFKQAFVKATDHPNINYR